MAKSTAAAALASLSYKFQAKIREVGQLKKLISEGNSANAEVQRLRRVNGTLELELLKAEKALSLSEFAVAQADAAYRRLESHGRDVDGIVKNLKADVSNWKSFTGVAVALGLAVGVLSTLAYIAQTTPL